MIEGIAFASCYVYSPAGESAICARSRLLRALLKEGDAHFMTKYAVRVRPADGAARACSQDFSYPATCWCPCPRSAPKVGGTCGLPAGAGACALVREGVGSATWPGLRRISAVRKSATAAKGCRPSVARHYDSLRLETVALRAKSVVIVDDVITAGRTLLAAAARPRSAPRRADSRIRAAADNGVRLGRHKEPARPVPRRDPLDGR